MYGRRKRKSSAPPVGLVVALVGVGGVALAGLARVFASAQKGSVSGLRDLPAHYPFYPRVMPSYQVPRKAHRDAQIIQQEEVNAAGKVILDEEIQPVQAERYLPDFATGRRQKLPMNPFEFGMGRMGTTRVRPTYPPGFEAVNATYERIDGVEMRRLAPSSPGEFASAGEMGTALDNDEDASDAEDRIRRVSNNYEGTPKEEGDAEMDFADADEAGPEPAEVEEGFEGEEDAPAPPAVRGTAASSQPPAGQGGKSGKRRMRIADMAEFGEYAGDIGEFEKLEDDLMEGTT